MEERLFNMYKRWTEQIVSECKDLCGDMYSNPCYLGVPDDWKSATNRIMIVGEEGYGDWGFGKKSGWNDKVAMLWRNEAKTNHGRLTADEKKKLEKELFGAAPIKVFEDNAVNIEGIKKLMNYNIWACGYHLWKDRKVFFWSRLVSIAELENCAVIWNNIDKIYSRAYRKNCKHALSEDERARLHSVETKILKEEIEILKPNVVVFFGWHMISLREELPDIAAEYDRSKDVPIEEDIAKMCDGSKVRIETKRYLCEINRDGVTYIMSYHPNWGNFQKGYEGAVLETVKRALNNSKKNA